MKEELVFKVRDDYEPLCDSEGSLRELFLTAKYQKRIVKFKYRIHGSQCSCGITREKAIFHYIHILHIMFIMNI